MLADHSIDAVLHFAGLKPRNESTPDPLNYYDHKVHGSQLLLQAIVQASVFYFVLNSSATAYGAPEQMPISEFCPANRLTNPYGRSEQMVQGMLGNWVVPDLRWQVAKLRYSHPVGAHEARLIGENPK